MLDKNICLFLVIEEFMLLITSEYVYWLDIKIIYNLIFTCVKFSTSMLLQCKHKFLILHKKGYNLLVTLATFEKYFILYKPDALCQVYNLHTINLSFKAFWPSFHGTIYQNHLSEPKKNIFTTVFTISMIKYFTKPSWLQMTR